MSLDRRRLGLILARLASDHAGERDAAVLAASRLLQAAGVRWESLAEAGGGHSDEDVRMAVSVWRMRAEQEARRADQLRTSSQTWGKRAVALERQVADLQARLDIAASENAKLRRALGPEASARAVFDGMPAAEAMRR